jgi:hypothetical protein
MYAGRTPPETPPCKTCKITPLPENEEAIQVYLDCRHQYAPPVPHKPLDISLPAVEASMRIHNVKDMEGCLSKVRRLFYHFLDNGGDEE